MVKGYESFAMRLVKELAFVAAFATLLPVKLRLLDLFKQFGIEDR